MFLGVSLFNKYRPQTFDDLIGQRAAVEIITNSIMKSSVSHAYLFSGSRGCGKTSAARIFAKAVNCKNPNGYEPCGHCSNCTSITAGESLDVIEIDGASNNGVENIRGLKENVTLAPFSSKYKIYIIDEVHMLSAGAFNALLKTLEEPPEYVIFIMATTDPQKVPVTIRSRCQHIAFHSISPEDIFARLNRVCSLEGVNAEEQALWEISRQADGALRDALSLLEQVIASGDVTLANVERVAGTGSRSAFERWVRTFRTDYAEAYAILKSMFDSGASGVRVFEEMFSLIRNLWLISKWKNITAHLGTSEQEKAFLNEEAAEWTSDDLHKLLKVIVKILQEARRGVRPDILLGMFALYAESDTESESDEEELPLPKLPVYSPEPLPISEPVIIAEPVTITNIPKDDILKEKLLYKAREENFLVYCWLYDSDVYDDNGVLTLRPAHQYCWSYMKTDRNAALVREVFSEYREVVIRYGKESKTCPKFKLKTKISLSTSKLEPKPQPATNSESSSEEMPEQKQEHQNMPESDEQNEQKEQKTHSKIDEFIRALKRAGASIEEIMQIEETEQNNNADEGETEE